VRRLRPIGQITPRLIFEATVAAQKHFMTNCRFLIGTLEFLEIMDKPELAVRFKYILV